MYVGERESHWPLGCSDVSLVREEGAINCCNDHMETRFHALVADVKHCCARGYVYIYIQSGQEQLQKR